MHLYHHTLFRVTNAKDIHCKRRCLGVSVVNLLVSMALGLIVLAAALQWYVVLKNTYFSEKNKRQILDIGRTVFQFIKQDIQSSGYLGCRTQDPNFPIRRNFEEKGIKNEYLKYLKIDRAVFGFRAEAGECRLHIPNKFCERLKANTDVLVVYNVPKAINLLETRMIKLEQEIMLQKNQPHHHSIKPGSMVLISDAQQGDVFIANDVKKEMVFHQLGKNNTDALSKNYNTDAEITELQTFAYYLGVPDRQVAEGDTDTYSLYRSDILHEPEEIVVGIVSFSVEYGLFESSTRLQYYPADRLKPDQWPAICMVLLKIETKGELTNGVAEKNHQWEYAFAIRNRHCVSASIGIADSHFSNH